MSFKENLKQAQRATGRYALIVIRGLVSRMPYDVYKSISGFLMFAGRPLLLKKKRIAMESLRIAYGNEKSEAELTEIANSCFENFGRGMVDLIYFIDRPDLIKEKVSFQGKEHLDAALTQGKGAILVSAHFGSFIMMYYRMVLEGYKTNVIMRRVRDAEFEKYISNFRQERGIQTIYDLPARKCVVDCIKALRNNEILFILIDQNYGSDGRVFVDFFGHDAATAAGPVVFGNRTGAPVLPTFIMKDDTLDAADRHKIVIDPPVLMETSGDEKQSVIHNVARLTKIIEKYVRLYPHEWGGWMHKRWKSRKVEEQAKIDAEASLRQLSEEAKNA